MPGLMLRAWKIGTWAAARSSLATCSGDNPVVPETNATPASAHQSANPMAASGLVKSITASMVPASVAGSSTTRQSLSPIAGDRAGTVPGRTIAPTSATPGYPCAASITSCPIRPAAPATAMRVVMVSPP